MVTRKLIELEAKRDAYEYARQIVDAVLNQEMHKVANLIKQEKDKISERYTPEQSISEEVKQS
tara:strand:- start:344 stop:532 length:189 start_codon:yes stop_codon:yes gene_type:complete